MLLIMLIILLSPSLYDCGCTHSWSTILQIYPHPLPEIQSNLYNLHIPNLRSLSWACLTVFQHHSHGYCPCSHCAVWELTIYINLTIICNCLPTINPRFTATRVAYKITGTVNGWVSNEWYLTMFNDICFTLKFWKFSFKLLLGIPYNRQVCFLWLPLYVRTSSLPVNKWTHF